MKIKRIFLIVLDSLGIGYMPDAHEYGDVGANTLKTICGSPNFNAPNLRKLGLFNIDGVDFFKPVKSPIASFARLSELSKGKDTIVGHFEIAGITTTKPLPTYKDGFNNEIIREFIKRIDKGVLCNKPYSGTQVLLDYGKEHEKTGKPIVYTSADSVFQVAAHESIVPIKQLYRYCKIAREIMVGDNAVGRIIARPFKGSYPNYERTPNRRDFPLSIAERNMLDIIFENKKDVLSIGKIFDIFAGKSITKSFKTKDNADGINKILEVLSLDFSGLCFANLVDFDMIYGHRNDIDGYAKAVSNFDKYITNIITELQQDDVLMITADHGCDPGHPGTDHTREYIPLIIYGDNIKPGVNLGTRLGFCDIAATVLDLLGLEQSTPGISFKSSIMSYNF